MKCKYGDKTKNEKWALEVKDLRACGCPSCEVIADKKELEEYRKYKEEKELQEQAQKQAEEIGKQIVEARKRVKEDFDQLVAENVNKFLEEKGINFLNDPFRKQVEQKMFYPIASKRVNINTRYGREQLSPEVKDFIYWAATGQSEFKSLDTNVAPGSYVVPDEMYNQIIAERDKRSIMRRAGAEVVPVNSGKISVPVEYNSGDGGWRTTEQQAFTESDPTLNEVVLDPHDWGRIIKVSNNMFNDSALNIADYLARLFGRNLAKAENAAFIAGDGNAKPTGLSSSTGQMIQHTPASGATIKEAVQGLYFSLPEDLRMNAVWYIHPHHLEKVLSALGTDWVNSYRDGMPLTILGRPVFEAPNIPAIDTDDVTEGVQEGHDIYFGDPSYYFIGEASNLVIERSTERFFEYGQTAFRAVARLDGKLAGSTTAGEFQPFAYVSAFVD